MSDMATLERTRRRRLPTVSGARDWLLHAPTAFWIALVEIALIIGFNIRSDGLFLTKDSVMNLALDAAVGMLLAVGMTFLLAAAQLNLWVGANLVLSSCVAALVSARIIPIEESFTARQGPRWTSLLACGAAIACGTAFGLVNGLIVTKLRVNSFIATLGTAGAASGLVLVWTNGSNITGFPEQLQTEFGVASIDGLLPYQMLIVLVIAAFLWFVMRKTRLGLHAVALGSSPSAVRRSGVYLGRGAHPAVRHRRRPRRAGRVSSSWRGSRPPTSAAALTRRWPRSPRPSSVAQVSSAESRPSAAA